ncbi:MAG: DNA primase [Planctomycetaceae bacterium]
MSDLIAEEKIKEIRERASIVEVVSDYVSLKKSGKNYLGLCPFHSERTPSFTVNEEKGIFHCFGCGTGGNVFNFLMRTGQMSFPEAVRAVAKRYNVPLPTKELSEEEKRRRSLKSKLYEVNETAAEYFHRILTSQKEGEEGRKYLAQRGISEETVGEHRLGFAPASWDSLVLFFQKKGIPLNLAETLGLILPRKEGAGGRPGYFDRFRRRVIFPIISEGGRVLGFGGRIIVSEEVAEGDIPPPKYMNSPESPLYSKGQTLYGLNAAKGFIREKGNALIVEGYMDLLSLYQAGFRNVVASLGTALTSAQLGLLARYAKESFLVFDGDESGQKATQRSLELFLQEGISARVVSLPAGYDPDSFIRREKAEPFARMLAGAPPLMEFLFEQALRRHPSESVEGKVRIVRELIPALTRLPDPLERNLYIERFALRLGLKESQIRDQLRGREPAAGEEKGAPPSHRGPAHERMLLQLMLLDPLAVPRVREVMGLEEFSDLRHQKLAHRFFDFWGKGTELDPQEFLGRVEEEDLRDLVSELLLDEGSVLDPRRMLEDCLRKVKLSRIRQEIREVDEEIQRRSRQEKNEPWNVPGLKELLKRKQRLILEQKRWTAETAGTSPSREGKRAQG